MWLLLVISLLLRVTSGADVKLTVETDSEDGESPIFSFKCTVDDYDDNHIASISLYKKSSEANKLLVATISALSPERPFSGPGIDGVTLEGEIEFKSDPESHLAVHLTNLKVEDLGLYICEVALVDDDLEITRRTAQARLVSDTGPLRVTSLVPQRRRPRIPRVTRFTRARTTAAVPVQASEVTVPAEEPTVAVKETAVAVEEPTVAVEEPTAVVEETTAAVEETTAAVEETTAAVEETTAAVEETTAAVEETTAAVEETTAAVEETTAAVEETTAAVEETTAAVEETTAAVEETTAAVEETTAAVEETTAAVEETTAAVEETTAADEETTAATEETTAGIEETTAGIEETTAGIEETTAGIEETTAGIEETTAGIEETTAGIEETTAGIEETTAGIEETTAGIEETTAGIEETTAGIEESTAEIEETTSTVEETTAVPEETTVPPVPESPLGTLVDTVESLGNRLDVFNETILELKRKLAALEETASEVTNDTAPLPAGVEASRVYFVHGNTSYFLSKGAQITDISSAQTECENRRFYLTEVNDAGELQAIAEEISPYVIEDGLVRVAGQKAEGQDVWLYEGSYQQVDFFDWGQGDKIAPSPPPVSECLALRKSVDGVNMVAVPCSIDQTSNFYILCEHDD